MKSKRSRQIYPQKKASLYEERFSLLSKKEGRSMFTTVVQHSALYLRHALCATIVTLLIMPAPLHATIRFDGEAPQQSKKPQKRTKKKDGGVEVPPDVQKRIDDLIARDYNQSTPKKGRQGSRRSTRSKRTTPQPKVRKSAREVKVPTTPRPSAKDLPEKSTVVSVAPSQSPIVPEEQTYSFSIKAGTAVQLIEAFARMTGLGVTGRAPECNVGDFVTVDELDYDQALSRVRTLLFKCKPNDPYTMLRRATHLEIIRINDALRTLDLSQMYPTVELFETANLPDDELALVIYTPKSGSVAALKPIRDFMPDYVRVAPLEERNAVTIYAIVSDIKKYLSLKDLFLGGQKNDPRTFEVIKVVYILPSEAVSKLESLMELDAARPDTSRRSSSSRRGSPSPSGLEGIPAPPVSVVPIDEQRVIIVRAMQDKIAEIKMLLPYLDVDTSEDFEPVIIPVKHVDASELVSTIQQVLAAATSGEEASTPAVRRRKRGSSGSSSVTTAGMTLIAHPSGESIIVIASAEQVERARKLVRQFDVQIRIEAHRIPIEFGDPQEIAAVVLEVYSEGKYKSKVEGGMNLTADANGGGLWFTGTERELTKVTAFIKSLDVPGSTVSLHIKQLEYQLPSFVVQLLEQYEGDSSGGSSKSKSKSRPRRSLSAASGKFTPDDETKRLFVLCTDEEWDRYVPFIDELDQPAREGPPFVLVPVEHLDPQVAIGHMVQLLPTSENKSKPVRFAETAGGIMVIGASNRELADIRMMLVELDRESSVVERTFDIQYADISEIKAAIEVLVGGANIGPAPRRSSTKGAPTVSTSGQADLIVIAMGSRLWVRTSPIKMAKVASLVADFDIEMTTTELRVYEDFPSGADIDAISGTLDRVISDRMRAVDAIQKGKVRGVARAVQFIPQSAAGKLLVIAEPSMFAEIERLLDVLRYDVKEEPVEVRFVVLHHADPEEVVEQIRPLMAMKERALIDEGELSEGVSGPSRTPSRSTRPRATASSNEGGRFHLAADMRNRRIVVAAPIVLLEEAVLLIGQFDQPSETGEMVFKTVSLQNSEPEAMVKAISEMMGTPSRSAARVSSKTATSGDGAFGSMFTIVKAPSGGAVVLRGKAHDVEEVSGWIERLDSVSVAGRVIKVFQIEHADISRLGDLIMSVVDTTPAKSQGRKMRPGVGGANALDDFDDPMFETTKTWIGVDLYMQADLLASTLIVATTQSKLRQIEPVIAQFNVEGESILKPAPPLPQMTYKLEYATAFDASYTLSMILDELWQPRDHKPVVDYALFDEVLIVKYSDESRFPEIEALIRKYVDKRSEEEAKVVRKSFSPPAGVTAEQAALWLKTTHPEVIIEVINRTETKDLGPIMVEVKPMNRRASAAPCVLPAAVTRMADGLLVAMVERQDKPPVDAREKAEQDALLKRATEVLLGQTQETTPSEKADSEKPKPPKTHPDDALKVYYDEVKGVFVVEGQQSLVDEVETWLDDLEEEAKIIGVPDIRIYRVHYINVFTAAEIIGEMFNMPKAQQQALQQQQRMQQQAALQAERIRQQQAARDRQKAQQSGQSDPTKKPDSKQQQTQASLPSIPKMAVRVFPNPRDRTLILRAEPNQYPAILELLATIDQPKPLESTFRTYHLEKLNAVEVEGILKDMLGLAGEKTRRPRTSTSSAKGSRASSSTSSGGTSNALPKTIMERMVTGAGELGVDPEQIKLSSNEQSNTIIAMAPKAALEYIGKLIEQLEDQDIPEREWKSYHLQFGDVEDVASYLATRFSPGGDGGGKRRESLGIGLRVMTAPTFIPYPRLSMLSVQAVAEQMLEIDKLIAKLDVSDGAEFVSIELKHVDAAVAAETLTAMFGRGSKTRSAPRRPRPGVLNRPTSSGGANVVFIGDAGNSILFFTAPKRMHEQIHTVVAQLEEQYQQSTGVRVVAVQFVLPTSIADAILSAYGSASSKPGRRPGRAQPTAKLSITPHDPTKQLFVVTDDATFAEVESLIKKLDKPGDMGFDFRVYPLKHANARRVYETMNKLLLDYYRQKRPQNIEAFSIDVDDHANALIVLGGATTFAFVEQSLAKVDTVANAASPPSFLMIPLKHADAAEVAQNINQLWANRNRKKQGVDPPQAQANRSANVLMVRGTQEQIDEIRRELIDPLESSEQAGLQTETFTLEFIDAEAAAEVIAKIFDDKRKALQGSRNAQTIPAIELMVAITPDPHTNQLIVQASESNLAFIKERVAMLDNESIVAGTNPLIKVYRLRYADSGSVAKIITEWARNVLDQGKRGGKKSPADTVVAVAESSTASVVVSATEKNHSIIAAMIAEVDAEDGSGSREVRSITLLYADANEMKAALETSFGKPSQGRGRGTKELVGNVRVSVLAQSNSIVLSGELSEVERLVGIVKDLDVAGEEGSIPHIIKLEYAKVGQILPTLEDTFLAQARGRGRGRPGQTPPVIVGNDALNAVVVRAGTTDLTAIRQMIAQLDTPETKAGMAFKIIKVAPGINVMDMADMVQNAMNDTASQRMSSGGRNARPSSVTVAPDRRSNTLVVSGDPTLFDEAESLVRSLEGMGPAGSKRTSIIKLTNIRVDDIQRLINQLTGQDSGGSRGRSSARRGGTTRRSTPSRPRSSNRRSRR